MLDQELLISGDFVVAGHRSNHVGSDVHLPDIEMVANRTAGEDILEEVVGAEFISGEA